MDLVVLSCVTQYYRLKESQFLVGQKQHKKELSLEIKR